MAEEEKFLTCDHCGKAFKTAEDLRTEALVPIPLPDGSGETRLIRALVCLYPSDPPANCYSRIKLGGELLGDRRK